MDRVFFYALGTTTAARIQFAAEMDRRHDARLVVEAASQRDCLLFQRPAWKGLARRTNWLRVLRGRRPRDTARPGDVIVVPDVAALGPAWRNHGKTIARILSLGLRVVVLKTHDGKPLSIASPLSRDDFERLRLELGRAMEAFHRRRIVEALAAARREGKCTGTAPFRWPIRGGRYVPDENDLRTIAEICRRHEAGERLKHIAADLAERGVRTAAGYSWNLARVGRAYRFGADRGWCKWKPKPWDFRKQRLAMRAVGDRPAGA